MATLLGRNGGVAPTGFALHHFWRVGPCLASDRCGGVGTAVWRLRLAGWRLCHRLGNQGPQGHRLWWLVLLEGIAGITFGVVTLIWPQITAFVLLLLIAGWAIATGILEIAAAILLRKELAGEWLLAVGGILPVVFGVLLVIQPQAGAIVVNLADRCVRGLLRYAADCPGLPAAQVARAGSRGDKADLTERDWRGSQTRLVPAGPHTDRVNGAFLTSLGFASRGSRRTADVAVRSHRSIYTQLLGRVWLGV